MERAVDFKYSRCSAVLGTQLVLAGAVLLPPRVATAASVPFPSLATCHRAADTVGGMRKMLRGYHALCQQEMPDRPIDKVPLEPSDRGRSRTPRDVPADMLPLPEEFKDLDKMGAAVIYRAPPPVAPVNKVVWEPMEALTQLGGVTDDSVMEEDSADAPLSPNSPSNSGPGPRNPPPPRSLLLIHQLGTVSKMTANDERLGNDAMGVQGRRDNLEGVLAGVGGFGNQDDQRELTPDPDVGDLLNASFFLEPGVSQVQSLALHTDIGVYADDSVMHVGDADGTGATVDAGDRATGERMMVVVGDFEAVAEGFFADASAPSPLLLNQDALGVEVQVSEEAAKDGSEMGESLSAQEAVKLVAWRKAFNGIPHSSPDRAG